MTIFDCPMPGETFRDGVVIASGVHRDDDRIGPIIYGALVLNKQKPFYTILEIVLDDNNETVAEVIDLGTEGNIVPATHVFHENFGFWGGHALTELGQGAPG